MILLPYHTGPFSNKPQLLMLIVLRAACLGTMGPISINDYYLCPQTGDWSRVSMPTWNKKLSLIHYLNCLSPYPCLFKLCVLEPDTFSIPLFIPLSPLYSFMSFRCSCLGFVSLPFPFTPIILSFPPLFSPSPTSVLCLRAHVCLKVFSNADFSP